MLAVFFVVLVLRSIRRLRVLPGIPGEMVVVFIAILVLDLPMMISFNVQRRYFLPLLPLLCVLSAFCITYLNGLCTGRLRHLAWIPLLGAFAVVVLSAGRVASIMLLLKNDARIPAGEFLSTLPEGTSIEYTLYSPNIPEDHFTKAHAYPLYFKKFPDAELPTDPRYIYNAGESGIEQRQTDYLVIDSLISIRFEDEYTCEMHQAECDFFNRLLAGESNYRLIADFKYELPWFLPQISITATNPEIKIFQRQP